jgi:hypothetical protein
MNHGAFPHAGGREPPHRGAKQMQNTPFLAKPVCEYLEFFKQTASSLFESVIHTSSTVRLEAITL